MVNVHGPDASGTTKVGVSDDDTHDDGVNCEPVARGNRGPSPATLGNGGSCVASRHATAPTGVMTGDNSTEPAA